MRVNRLARLWWKLRRDWHAAHGTISAPRAVCRKRGATETSLRAPLTGRGKNAEGVTGVQAGVH